MTRVQHTMTPDEEARWSGRPPAKGASDTPSLLDQIERYRPQPKPAPAPYVGRGPRPGTKPPRTCVDCGEPVANPTSIRCAKHKGHTLAAANNLRAYQTPPKPREAVSQPSTAAPEPVSPCSLTGCEDDATETGRCVKHEAIWQRLHATR